MPSSLLEAHLDLFTQLQPLLLSRARATTLTVLRRSTIEASGGRKYGSLRKKWTSYVGPMPWHRAAPPERLLTIFFVCIFENLMFSQNKDGALDVSELGLLMDPRHYIHSLNEVLPEVFVRFI